MRTYTLFLTFFFLLSSPALAVIEITGSGHPSGPGACDGFIDVLAEGSAGPFRLEISGPGEYSDFVEGIDGGYTFEGLCSGDYVIEIDNSYRCVTVLSLTLTEEIPCEEIRSILSSITESTTCEENDGAVSFRGVDGGAPPYRFAWSNGASTHSLPGVSAGIYELTITDANDCSTVETYEIFGKNQPKIIAENIAPACVGGNNGFIVLFADQTDGGQVSFDWNGQGDEVIGYNYTELNNLAPGTYCVEMTNEADGCPTVRCFEVAGVAADLPLSLSSSINHSCPEISSGDIHLAIAGGVKRPAGYPYQIQWSTGAVNVNQINDLTPGTYCVTVTDYCGSVATECYDIDVDPSLIFDLTTSALQHAGGADTQDGSITVQVIPGIQEDYSFQWSHGPSGHTVSDLAAGIYTVTATNTVTGCEIVKSYEVKNCETVEDFEMAILGGEALDPGVDIEFEVWVKQNGGNYSNELPPGYSVVWKTVLGNVLGYGPTLTVDSDFPANGVEAFVSNGCWEKKDWKPVLRCNTTNENGYLRHIFVVSKNDPCVGFSDGSISLAIPRPGNRNVSARIDYTDLPVAYVGENAFIEIGNLVGNEVYTVQISIGECTFSFDFQMDEKPTEKEFHHADEEKQLCYYSESCYGIPFGEDNLYQEAMDLSWDETGSGNFDRCETPMYCGNQVVGTKEFKKKWVGAKEYLYMLLQAGEFEYYQSLLNRLGDHNACRKVKYCEGSLLYITSTALAPFKSDDPKSITRDPVTGCDYVECRRWFNNTDYWACPHATDPARQGGEPPVEVCNARSQNVYEAYVMYNAVKKHHEEIAGTELGIFLEQHGLSDEAKCATVTYCSEDLSYITDDLNYVAGTCGLPVYSCGVQVGISCSKSEIRDADGNLIGHRTICAGTNGICPGPKVDISGICEYTNETFPDIHIQFDLDEINIDDIVDDASDWTQEAISKALGIFKFISLPKIIRENPLGCYNFFTESQPQADLSIKTLTDTFQNEVLREFGIAKSSGVPYPRGIVSNQGESIYYEYDHEAAQVSKEEIPNIEYFIEDWDYEHLIYLEQLVAGKESRLVFEDTTVAWINTIAADSLFKIAHLSSQGYDIVVGGSFSGALVYDSATVAQTDNRAAFLLRISKDGALENLHILDQVVGEAVFSENRRKNIVLAALHDGSAAINGSPIPSGGEAGLAVLRIDSLDQVRIYGDIRGGQSLDLLDVTYADDTSHIGAHVALALRGTGALDLNGIPVFNHTSENLSILSLDTLGQYNWHSIASTDSLDTGRFDMTYGPDNQLYVGATTNMQSTGFPAGGGDDILLTKIDAQGDTVWNKWHGTGEDETVSQVLYDHGVLYFGGEFTGSVGDKTIGNYVFSNLVAVNSKAYISYVFDEAPLQVQEEEVALRSEKESEETSSTTKTGRQITAYPNPFNDKLYIRTNGLAVDHIEIVNSLGQVLYQFSSQNADLSNLEVDFSKPGGGLYLVKGYDREGALLGVRKVVKQR